MVQVQWLDAECTGNSGWEDPNVMQEWAETPPPTMYSVGYLIHDGPVWITLVDTIGPNEVGTANKIPKGMIINIQILSGDY
jgi:hypothetical protein